MFAASVIITYLESSASPLYEISKTKQLPAGTRTPTIRFSFRMYLPSSSGCAELNSVFVLSAYFKSQTLLISTSSAKSKFTVAPSDLHSTSLVAYPLFFVQPYIYLFNSDGIPSIALKISSCLSTLKSFASTLALFMHIGSSASSNPTIFSFHDELMNLLERTSVFLYRQFTIFTFIPTSAISQSCLKSQLSNNTLHAVLGISLLSTASSQLRKTAPCI